MNVPDFAYYESWMAVSSSTMLSEPHTTYATQALPIQLTMTRKECPTPCYPKTFLNGLKKKSVASCNPSKKKYPQAPICGFLQDTLPGSASKTTTGAASAGVAQGADAGFGLMTSPLGAIPPDS